MKALSIRPLAVFLLLLLTLQSCKKDEGLGGTSTIKGRVIIHDFDSGYQLSEPAEIYPAADERVYIIYGPDNTIYDDDFDTSYDGYYEFKYLQKGTYRIFVYTEDSAGAFMGNPSLKDIPVFLTVEIPSNGSTVNAPDIIILDNKQ